MFSQARSHISHVCRKYMYIVFYFAQSNPKHTLSLHNALLKRITQLASVQQSSDAEESSENKTESNPTSNTEHESPS